MIEALIKARLIVTRRGQDPEPSGSLIELAHESLIIRWKDLVRWIEEENETLVFRNEIEPDVQRWDNRGRRSQDTWDHDRLQLARDRIERLEIDLSADFREFLAASDAEVTRKRRLKTGIYAGIIVGLASISGVAIVAAVQATEIDLAAADIGKFELAISPYDWDAQKLKTASASELSLDWRLHTVDPRTPRKPGALVDSTRLKRKRVSAAGDPILIDEIETRSGPAVLEVFGRGRANEKCASSWIPMIALPGFAARNTASPKRLSVKVPTCGATSAGTREIAAGEFMQGGPGDPPARPQDISLAQVIRLDTYRIDETEVSNAAFSIFASLEPLTGIGMPRYPTNMSWLVNAEDPSSPVSNIDAATAEAFCRFMGKRLPTSHEWEKAARGGTFLDSLGEVENEAPNRSFPWGREPWTNQANLDGDPDGWDGVAPVYSYPEGKSPYELFNMLGNVAEWTTTPQNPAEPSGHLLIRGGAWDTDAKDDLHYLADENSRDPRFFAYNIGLRCVSGSN